MTFESSGCPLSNVPAPKINGVVNVPNPRVAVPVGEKFGVPGGYNISTVCAAFGGPGVTKFPSPIKEFGSVLATYTMLGFW
jgi:hypothetical protein